MIRSPKFWYKNNLISQIFVPISFIWIFIDFLKRKFSNPYKSKLKIICVGNVNVGGSGKTPLCIHLFRHLKELKFNPIFLSSGYGGKNLGPIMVNKYKEINFFGDEAILLSKYGPTIVSKNSTINGNVRIGKGSLIVSGSVINTGTKIGEHCLINTSSSIDHNNIFKNFSSTGPGVTTGGNVELGQCSHVGIGATIKNQISIGDNTIVGARSLLLKNCKKNSVYYGIPAKKIRGRKYNSKYL